MVKTRCSTCHQDTVWIEYADHWSCSVCGRTTQKQTREQAQRRLEDLQEEWSKLEQSIGEDHFLNKPENKAILELLMTDIDKTLSDVRKRK